MTDARKPVRIEIVAYAPTAFYHCTHCEIVWKETGFSQGLRAEQVASALPADMLQDYQAVSEWVHRLLDKYCDRVMVKVIDAASIEGVLMSVRHRLGHYPAVIVDGRERYIGLDWHAAEAEIDRHLALQAARSNAVPGAPGSEGR